MILVQYLLLFLGLEDQSLGLLARHPDLHIRIRCAALGVGSSCGQKLVNHSCFVLRGVI